MATRGPQDQLGAQVRDMLRQRATDLAAESKKIVDHILPRVEEAGTYLAFRLGPERYAIALQDVVEVVALKNVIAVPGAPIHIFGLTRLRGIIMALVDLRLWWFGASIGHAQSDLAVIVRVGRKEFGLVCNEVNRLIDTTTGFGPVPPHLDRRIASCLDGLIEHQYMAINPMTLIEQDGFVPRGTL